MHIVLVSAEVQAELGLKVKNLRTLNIAYTRTFLPSHISDKNVNRIRNYKMFLPQNVSVLTGDDSFDKMTKILRKSSHIRKPM